jgi:dihydrolipoamide dehydrogenase
MADYDLVVLGAGPGGYVGAIRAAQLGLRTAVVEADRLGGVCGNWGCIPSKALLADAELYRAMRDAARRGLVAADLRVDFPRVIARSREVADRQAKGVEQLLRKHRIDVHAGRGRLVAGGGVAVSPNGSGPARLGARHVLLATGSAEQVLSGLEVDGRLVVTSREALEDRELPASVVIVGGGAVGVEFAYVYASFGARVTVVEMLDTLLPGMDEDLGRELARAFRRQGIEVLTGHRFERLERDGATGRVTVAGPGGARTIEAARVLVAVGRRPLTDGLGLEEAGVRTTKRGFVVVDEAMRTTAPNVHAIGDLVGPFLLAHTASEQAVTAVEAIAGRRGNGATPPAVPMCVYCQPEVAAVGLTQAQAREKHGDVRVGKFPFRALGKAMATGETEGFVKLVAVPPHGAIVGVHLVGHHVTELVAEAALALTLEATTAELIETVHAHPTLAEALREAALAAEGRAINA